MHLLFNSTKDPLLYCTYGTMRNNRVGQCPKTEQSMTFCLNISVVSIDMYQNDRLLEHDWRNMYLK